MTLDVKCRQSCHVSTLQISEECVRRLKGLDQGTKYRGRKDISGERKSINPPLFTVVT